MHSLTIRSSFELNLAMLSNRVLYSRLSSLPLSLSLLYMRSFADRSRIVRESFGTIENLTINFTNRLTI